MSVRKIKIDENNSVDIHDIWMPELLGVANQILKVNKDKTGLEFGNLLTKSAFINGALKAGTNQKIVTTSVKNKIYFMQCYDSSSNLQEFTVDAVSKPVKGKFAMVIFGRDYTNSLAFVQTGSALITELAKTTSRVTGFIPSKGNFLHWFEIDGTLEAFKGDDGSATGVIIDAPASAVQGDLTVDQLSTLQASDNNYIVFNNELYRLADKQHTTGILSYTHSGWNGTAMQDKSINITVSTRAWTLVVGQEGGGTNVVANPGDGSTRITDIQIGDTKYFILPAKYEKYLKDNTFTEPTVILGVSIVTSTVKDGKFLYNQTITVNISHREVKNDATSLSNLTLYWRGSSIQSNIAPSINTTATIISSGSYKLSTSNNKFQLKLPYVADGDSGNVSSYKDIPSGYALWYGAGDAATRLDTTNIKNIVSSGSVNISVETTASQRITIMFPGTVTAKTNASFSTDVPLTKTGTVSLPVYSGSSGTTILADAVTYNIYQTELLKAGTNDITLTLTGGN